MMISFTKEYPIVKVKQTKWIISFELKPMKVSPIVHILLNLR